MIELIFAGGRDPVRSSTCRRTDRATILADSVVLLQTPAVAEPTEVGIELSAEASHVVTGIPSASRSPAVRERHGRHARDPRSSVVADDVMTVPLSLQRIRELYTTLSAALEAYDQHLGLTTSRRRS